MSSKVTMQVIADYLGVSKFVVSKALSGKGGVSPETEQRVFEAAALLGYQGYARRGGHGAARPRNVQDADRLDVNHSLTASPNGASGEHVPPYLAAGDAADTLRGNGGSGTDFTAEAGPAQGSAADRDEGRSGAGEYSRYTHRILQGAPSSSGRGGVLKSVQTVLILLPNVRFQTKESLFWGKILDAISRELEQSGMGMVVVTEPGAEHLDKLIRPDAFMGVIGIGFVPTGLLLALNRYGLPVVLVDHEDPLVATDTVFINNIDASAALTGHLIGLGHQRIGFAGNNDWSRSFFDRWLGFVAAMENNRLYKGKQHHYVLVDGRSNAEMIDGVTEWARLQLQTAEPPTALVCANDAIAACVLQAVAELDWPVPSKLSVTGFDNSEVSYRSAPPITTVDVSKEEIGQRAVEMLLRRLQRKQAAFEKVLLSCSPVYRQSTGTPPPPVPG